MIDTRAVLQLVQDDPAWKLLIDRLHDDAGLDVYDDELIFVTATEVMAAMVTEIHEMTKSGFMRESIVRVWREKKEKATGATVAS